MIHLRDMNDQLWHLSILFLLYQLKINIIFYYVIYIRFIFYPFGYFVTLARYTLKWNKIFYFHETTNWFPIFTLLSTRLIDDEFNWIKQTFLCEQKKKLFFFVYLVTFFLYILYFHYFNSLFYYLQAPAK